MEFERAIYRVYERSIEGLIPEEDPSRANEPVYNKSCRLFEIIILFLGFSLLICLTKLHLAFVGYGGCLADQLTHLNRTTNRSELYQFKSDQVLAINLKGTHLLDGTINHALGAATDDDDDNNHSGGAAGTTLNGINSLSQKSSTRYLTHRTISEKKSSSAVKTSERIRSSAVSYMKNGSQSRVIALHRLIQHYLLGSPFGYDSHLYHQPTDVDSNDGKLLMAKATLPHLNGSKNINRDTNSSSNHAISSSSSSSSNNSLVDEGYDYTVTFNEGVLLLSEEDRKAHNFDVINVTINGKHCLGGTSLQSLLAVGGVDIAILNQVMFTTKQPGFMVTSSGDFYHWHEEDLITKRSAHDWLSWKLSIVVTSLIAFFLLSTTTALLVRVLISSGVIIVFPLFWLFQSCGMQGISMRVISLSYPWIGLPLQLIRQRNLASGPFVCAHITRVVMYYLLYIAAQNVYIHWIYNGVAFGTEQLWLYALMMLWEYYSMIFLRSEASILFFPRASLALFLLYHFYYFSFPSGFHLLALAVMFCFLLFMMSYCVRKFEVKAYRLGFVSFDQPR